MQVSRNKMNLPVIQAANTALGIRSIAPCHAHTNEKSKRYRCQHLHGAWIAAICTLCMVGCQSSSRGNALENRDASYTGAADASLRALIGSSSDNYGVNSKRTDITVVALTFDIMRVALPIGTLSHSRKIWNHVDELAVDATKIALLARNGLRVGVASPDAWPAIRTVLVACDAEIRQDQFQSYGGLPLVIETSEITEMESFFAYGAGHRLAGKSFSQGKKLVTLDYIVYAAMGGLVDVKLTYEIRHDRGTVTWENVNGVISPAPAFDRYVFEDLTTNVSISPGSMLILGPSDEAHNEYLVGSRFFMERRGGDRYEVLYMITPITRKKLDHRK